MGFLGDVFHRATDALKGPLLGGAGSSSGGSAGLGTLFGGGFSGAKPFDSQQFGVFSPEQQDTYYRDPKTGAPMGMVADSQPIPQRPMQTGQFVPGAPGMFMGNQPLQQATQPMMPQQPQGMPQQPQGQIPYLPPQSSGPFTMPQYGSMDKVTHYDSAFDRFHNIAAQMQNAGNTPWNNPNMPKVAQALMYGFTPWQQRMALEKNAIENQVKYSQIMGNLAGASAADQEGLEHNTKSYGNIADTYRAERMAPYEQRTEYEKGSHQGDMGAAAAALAQQRQDVTPSLIVRNQGQASAGFGRGAQGFAKANEIQQLTPDRKALLQQQGNTQISIQDKNYSQADQIDELTPRKASESESRTKLNNARAANSGKASQTPQAVEAKKLIQTYNDLKMVFQGDREQEKLGPPDDADARKKYAESQRKQPGRAKQLESIRQRLKQLGVDPDNAPAPQNKEAATPPKTAQAHDDSDVMYDPLPQDKSQWEANRVYQTTKGPYTYLGNDKWQRAQ